MGLNEESTPFRLVLPADGRAAVVEVAGVDVAEQVAGLTLECAAGRRPLLSLFGAAGGTVHGEGIVQASSSEADPGSAVVGFLASLDPLELERVTLARDDLGNEEGCVTRAMLRQLAEWASGG